MKLTGSDELTQEERERIIDSITSFQDKIKCEVCGSHKWGLTKRLMSVRALSLEKPSVDYTNEFPFFIISCIKCGNSKIFSAKIMGYFSEDINGN